MRNSELLIDLLRQMAEEPDGTIIFPLTMGMSDQDLAKHHHLELLADSGHAERKSAGDLFRITNDGYDFLNAVENNEPAKSKFLELSSKGMPYLAAVTQVLALIK